MNDITVSPPTSEVLNNFPEEQGNEKDFENIQIGKLNIHFNHTKKEVKVDIPLVKGIATLISQPVKNTVNTFDMRLEIDGKNKFSFKIDRQVTNIGSNKNSNYYKILFGNMQREGITPDYYGDEFKDKFNNLVLDLQTAHYDVMTVTQSTKWIFSQKEEEVKTWAEFIGNYETFEPDILDKSMNILKNGNFLEYAVDVIGERTVAQKPKITLALLIAMSSALKIPLNSLSIASPGKGKSRITEQVVAVFPNQRKFEFNTESSVAGLINMTHFAEGSEIFKNKLMYLGDLGNENEQKNPKVQELISMFKILMSSQKYNKIITDMQSDEGKPKTLSLEGCGSVMVESAAKKVESQFADRSVIWSPDDNGHVKKSIENYQTDELNKIKSDHHFNKQRPVVASGINQIFSRVEKLSSGKCNFSIVNPYGKHMLKLFPTDQPTVTSRDINHLLMMPKIVSLMNIFQRKLYYNQDYNAITLVVSPEDYVSALNSVGKSLSYMLSPIPENVHAYMDMIQEEYVNNQIWPYSYEELRNFFNDNLDYSDQDRSDFNDFINTHQPIYTGEMGELMHVESTTAREYLNNLSKMGALYKKKEGTYNSYYIVNNFDEIKRDSGLSFIQPNELASGTPLRKEIDEIFKDFLRDMKEKGYTHLKKGI